MNVKLDENLPSSLVQSLAELGHEVDTVPQEGLSGCVDAEVWRAAQDSGRFLITQDLDFSDARRFSPGTHHGILLVRLRNPGRRTLLTRIVGIFETEDVEQWSGCFVILTERKLRVVRSGT